MVRTFNAKTGMLDSGLEFVHEGNDPFVLVGDRRIFFCPDNPPKQILGLTVNNATLKGGRLVNAKRGDDATVTLMVVGAHKVRHVGRKFLDSIESNSTYLIKAGADTRISVTCESGEFNLYFDPMGQLIVNDRLAMAA